MLSKSDNLNIIKRVYNSLKSSVVSHHFVAGERLNIETLAEELRVSITPVRETLLRLVAEGLIINVPKMGFFMRTLSEADIRDLYEMNHILTAWSISQLISDKVPGLVLGMPELVALHKKLSLAISRQMRQLPIRPVRFLNTAHDVRVILKLLSGSKT